MKTYIIGFMLFVSIVGIAIAAEAGNGFVALIAVAIGIASTIIYNRLEREDEEDA